MELRNVSASFQNLMKNEKCGSFKPLICWNTVLRFVSHGDFLIILYLFQAQIDHYLGLANKNVKDAVAK